MPDQTYASVSPVTGLGMITIRGDLEAVGATVSDACGVAMPEVRRIVTAGGRALAWMSPDELLLICEHGEVEALIAALEDALDGQHSLVFNVSDARAAFDVTGRGAREVLAKLTPVDMTPAAFGAGDFRRTKLAQVAGAFWLTGDQAIRVICFRSLAEYTHELLKTAAHPASEVGVL